MDNVDLRIVAKYTDIMTPQEENDFCHVFHEVYDDLDVECKYKKKYKNNIYGPSLVVLAYHEGQCVGIQAFLRNDVGGKEAYQSNDSATLNEYRGRGIFSAMVKAGVKELEGKGYIYGFPNNESLPAFIRMGWNVGERMKYGLLQRKEQSDPDLIPDDYLKWLEKEPCKLRLISAWNRHYLVKKRTSFFYVVVGQITDDQRKATSIKRIPVGVMMRYSKAGRFGNGMVPIWVGDQSQDISIYKMDTILTA